MRRKILPLLLIAALFVGCASTPREQYVNVQDAFITSVESLNEARDHGEFTEEEWQEDIRPWINLGDEALDEYDAATKAGQPTDHAESKLRRAYDKLAPFVQRASEILLE